MKYAFSILVAACLLLPSCVRCHIGAVIRDAADVRVGVDVAHPVDGKFYRAQEQGSRSVSYYAYAPEVFYHQRTPWVEFDDAPGEPPHSRPAVRLRPTGRVVLARMELKAEPLRGLEHKIAYHPLRFTLRFKEELPSLPPQARLCLHQPAGGALRAECLPRLVERRRKKSGANPPPPSPAVINLGTLEYRRCWPASIAAAPFDYVIDPVLSGVSTAACWTGVALAVPFISLAVQVQQEWKSWQRPAPRFRLFRGELEPACQDITIHPVSERPDAEAQP